MSSYQSGISRMEGMGDRAVSRTINRMNIFKAANQPAGNRLNTSQMSQRYSIRSDSTSGQYDGLKWRSSNFRGCVRS